MRVFEQRPDHEATIFAEAQSLIDEGLDRALVIELYPEEANWLAPMLGTTEMVIDATRESEPSWYFEASLKQRFVEAGERRARTAPAPVAPALSAGHSYFRAGLAGTAVAAAAGGLWILAYGFLTADQASPGDWNYAFKLGDERFDYQLADGEARVAVQIRQTQERVQEIVKRSDSGSITEEDLARLDREVETLHREAAKAPLAADKQDDLRDLGNTAVQVLQDVRQRQPELEPAVQDSVKKVYEAVAAGTGGPVTTVEVPTPTPTSTVEVTPTPTATPTATATPTETPTSTPSPSQEPSPQPTPEVTPSPNAEQTAGVTETVTQEEDPTTEPESP